MVIEIDFESSEALYRQLSRQIIMLIANDSLKEGDSLPSVRDMAEDIGINMHTVNKAYSLLREEGYLSMDRRRGAVVCIDSEKLNAEEEMKDELKILVAKARCRHISREEMHTLIDDIYEEYE